MRTPLVRWCIADTTAKLPLPITPSSCRSAALNSNTCAHSTLSCTCTPILKSRKGGSRNREGSWERTGAPCDYWLSLEDGWGPRALEHWRIRPQHYHLTPRGKTKQVYRLRECGLLKKKARALRTSGAMNFMGCVTGEWPGELSSSSHEGSFRNRLSCGCCFGALSVLCCSSSFSFSFSGISGVGSMCTRSQISDLR